MSSSLALSPVGELLPTNPRAPGYHLGGDYDLGEPQSVTATVEALLLDGERVRLTHVGNRALVLPIIVLGSDRDDLTAKVDALLAGVADEGYTLTWTPDGGLPIIWDCFAGQATVRWDVRVEDAAFGQQVDLVIPALPFGRSPDAVTPTLTETLAVSAGKLYTLADLIGSARSPIGAELSFAGAVDAWLIHRPPRDADPDAPILVELTGDTAAISDAELLRGTYTVVLGVSTYGAVGEDRTVTVTISQDGTDVTQQISTAYVSALNLRQLAVGNVTLPLVDRPASAASDLTVTVDDSGGSAYLAVMLLDTRGQTVQALAPPEGVSYPTAAWVDEPEIGAVVGPLWASATGARSGAYAVTEPRISGGPLALSARDEGGALLIWAAGNVPDEPVLGYYPRWLAERVE